MDDAKTSTTVYVMTSKIFSPSIVLDVSIIQNQIAGFVYHSMQGANSSFLQLTT